MAVGNLKKVFILQHVHEFEDGYEDIKLLGVFSSESKAKEMIEKYKKMPGFRNYPDGFSVDMYILDKAEWTEGFVTSG